MNPLRIQILSDGKPGHENQSYGLAEAIGRVRPVEISKIALGGVKGAIARFRQAWLESAALPKPHLLMQGRFLRRWQQLKLLCKSTLF